MAIHISVISILLLVSLSISTQFENICTQTEDFDSAFMLSGDTFLKTTSGKIWRMNATRFNEGTTLGHPWKTTARMIEFEDNLYNHLSKYQPIYAFDYQYDYNDLCIDNETINVCYLHQVYAYTTYVCFYGHENGSADWKVVPMSYDNYNIYILPDDEPTLKAEVTRFCQFQLDLVYDEQKTLLDCDKSVLAGWNALYRHGNKNSSVLELSQFYICQANLLNNADKVLEIIFSLYERNNIESDILQSHRSLIRLGSSLDIPKRETKIVVPIAINAVQYHFSCASNPCKPSQPLNSALFSRYNIFNAPFLNDSALPRVTTQDLTILKLLRCPNAIALQVDTFAPNYFCFHKEFDSIFSLRDDIYFQKDAKFWRYSALSSTKESIEEYKHKVMNIRYDSYATNILAQYFNISEVVSGFTLTLPEGCDKYGPAHKFDCPVDPNLQWKLHTTCIGGITRGKNPKYAIYPFINTPAGFKAYPKNHKHLVDLEARCKYIVEPYFHDKLDRLHVSFANNLVIFSNYSSVDYNILYHAFDRHTFEIQRVVALLMVVLKPRTDNIKHKIVHIVSEDKNFNYNDVFYYKPIGWVAYKRNPQGLKVKVDGQLYTGPEVHFTIPLNRVLLELMNCTENSMSSVMSDSLVSIQNPLRRICRPHETSEPVFGFSAFNIGEYVYFQTEQQFYRYIPKEDKQYENGFALDKQISELLNDIFDTTERVVGYSFRYSSMHSLNEVKYRVILMGKPKWHYFKFFNRSVIYRVFEKEIGPFAPLVAINHLPQYEGLMEYPFDAVEFYFNKLYPLQPSPTPVSMQKLGNYQTLDGVAFLQLHDRPDVENKHIAHNPSTHMYPSFFLAVINDTYLYNTNEAFTFFTKPLLLIQDNSRFETVEYVNKFKKIYGVFSYGKVDEEKLYIMAIATNSEAPKLYRVSYSVALQDDWKQFGYSMHLVVSPDEILTFESTSIEDLFSCYSAIHGPQPDPRPSILMTTSSPLPLIVMFLLLVLIFAADVAIIGFVTFKKYEFKPKNKTN